MLYVPRGMVHHTSTAAVDPSADAWWPAGLTKWRFWPSLWTFVSAFSPSTSLSEHDSPRQPPVANPGEAEGVAVEKTEPGVNYSVHMTLGLETEVVSATYNRLIICSAVLAAPAGTTWLSLLHRTLQLAETIPGNSALRAALPLGFRDPGGNAAGGGQATAAGRPDDAVVAQASVISMVACCST